MTNQSVSNYKPNASVIERISGHYELSEFIGLVNEARNYLGSTNLFGTSYKIDLSNELESNDPYLTNVMYMPPSDSSGLKNFCPWATDGCRAVCLGVGSGRMNHGYKNLAKRNFNWNKDNTSKAQLKRAELFVNNQSAFIALMIVEIDKHAAKAAAKGLKAATRPNMSRPVLMPPLYSKQKSIIFQLLSKVCRLLMVTFTICALKTRPAII